MNKKCRNVSFRCVNKQTVVVILVLCSTLSTVNCWNGEEKKKKGPKHIQVFLLFLNSTKRNCFNESLVCIKNKPKYVYKNELFIVVFDLRESSIA